jgi:hypothetical protein
MNETPIQKDLTMERNERCIPLAEELAKIIAASPDFVIVETASESSLQKHSDISEKVLQFFLDNNVAVGEISYIFQLMYAPFDSVKLMVENSINMHLKKAQDILFEKDAEKITIGDLDKILKTKTK